MTLKQLEAFYWAAVLGNFAIAAERLHITQSTLSKRIVDLETDMNCVLFDRSGKKSELTEAGSALLPSARTMLDLRAAARAELARVNEQDALTGVCRFGISELSATTWFPRFVDMVRAAHPKLVLEPKVSLTRELERDVERGELDFAVVAGPAVSEALACQQVAEVPLAPIASPYRMRPSMVLTPDELQRHDILTHSPESGLASTMDNWLATHELKARRTIICNSLTVITTLTVAGVGMSFLPMHYVQPLVRQGRLTTLTSAIDLPPLRYNLIWHRDDVRNMTRTMKEIVLPAVDFSIVNPLWVQSPPHRL